MTSSSLPVINLENICFGYDSREILHNINLKIEKGYFTIIVGPNGGGKTTLLRLILGLLQPQYGYVKILGCPPEQMRKKIGYVPQSLQFDKRFPVTVLDVVLMGRVDRKLFGFYRRKDKEYAKLCIEEVGLSEEMNESFAKLSGGQQQRVLIAQALATQPELLLLDEPCANLDTPGTRTIYHLLQKLNRHLTIVMVSHNLDIIEPFASHIICVNRTAQLHKIADISKTALKNGDWLQLTHNSCPINQGDHGEQNEPHKGEPRQNHAGEIFHD